MNRYGSRLAFSSLLPLSGAKSGGAIGNMLDERSEKIGNELKEASALRDAALEELQSISGSTARQQKKPKPFCNLPKRLRSVFVKQPRKMPLPRSNAVSSRLDAKIKAAEASMVAELRERAAALLSATATEIITSKLDEKASLALVDSAAAEIEKLN